MKDRHEREYPPAGAEFFPPSEEFFPPAAEVTAPAAEFSSLAAERQDETAKRKRLLRKKMLYLVAAFAVAATLALPRVAGNVKPPQDEPAPTETQPVPTETEPVPTQTEPAPTEPPETQPTVATYPLGDGSLEITVYNSSPNPEDNWNDHVLYQATVPETEFTDLTLPAYIPHENYNFLGFVLNGSGNCYLLTDTLRTEDVQLVEPDENGVRHVNIHAAWEYAGGGDPWIPLILDPNDGDPAEEYDATSPLASGGTVWPCAFPAPARDGYVFAGWYETPECTGEPVQMIPAHDFFPETENDRDWSNPIPLTLYARWLPET